MEIEQQQAGLIDHFVKQAEDANNVDSLLHVITLATSHPFLFTFSEISSAPTFDQLQGTEKSAHLDLLHLFAHGTWSDYKRNAGCYPHLVPAQSLKLKQLALLKLAKTTKMLPYDSLIEVLDIANDSELEFFINECMHVGIVRGILDTCERCFEVKCLAGSDLIPGQQGNMFETKTDRLEAGKLLGPEKSVKRRMAESIYNIEEIRADHKHFRLSEKLPEGQQEYPAKTEELVDASAPKGGREERVREDVVADSSAFSGRFKVNDKVLFKYDNDIELTINELVSPYLYFAQGNDGVMYVVNIYQSEEAAKLHKKVRSYLKSSAFPVNMILGKLDDTCWSLVCKVDHESDPLEDWITRDENPYVFGSYGQPIDINPNIKLVLRGIGEALLELLFQNCAYGIVRGTIRIDRATQKPLMLGTFIDGTQANYNYDMEKFYGIVYDLQVIHPNYPIVILHLSNLYRMWWTCPDLTTTWNFAKCFYQNPLLFSLEESISFMLAASEAFHTNSNWANDNLNLQYTSMNDWKERVVYNDLFNEEYETNFLTYNELYRYPRFRRNIGLHHQKIVTKKIEDAEIEKMWIEIFPDSYFAIYNEVVKLFLDGELEPEAFLPVLDKSVRRPRNA